MSAERRNTSKACLDQLHFQALHHMKPQRERVGVGPGRLGGISSRAQWRVSKQTQKWNTRESPEININISSYKKIIFVLFFKAHWRLTIPTMCEIAKRSVVWISLATTACQLKYWAFRLAAHHHCLMFPAINSPKNCNQTKILPNSN